jgi:hypothetical protein
MFKADRFTNTDPGLEDTSESFGLPATADFMFALISTEELEQLNNLEEFQILAQEKAREQMYM